jgi:hypothetical protein
MKTFTITIQGKQLSDIEDALSYVVESISDSNLYGFGGKDTGSYDFESEGDFEEVENMTFSFYDSRPLVELRSQLPRLVSDRRKHVLYAWKTRRTSDDWGRRVRIHNARCHTYYVRCLEQHIQARELLQVAA